MAFADRGGASGLIGHRWADLSVEAARCLIGADRQGVRYHRVIRLDDVPAIASTAAKRSLQNPDLLLVGERDGEAVIQAADAKFSVETARAKQVSPEVVESLLGLGPVIDQLLIGIEPGSRIEPGFFISPDYPLTHAMLGGRHGILRTTVRLSDVCLVTVSGHEFFEPVEGSALMAPLAGVDRLGVDIEASLLAALYYFRLARAAVGCWIDSVKPLLFFNDLIAVDVDAIMLQVLDRAQHAPSGYRLIQAWNDDVEAIRAQRAEVDRVTGLPLMTRELKSLTLAAMKGLPGEPPSANQVRRRLGAWFRRQLRDELGPMQPPVDDLDAALRTAGEAAKRLAARVPDEAIRVIRELAAQRVAAAEAGGS